MANVNAPFGLRPVRYANGQPYNGAVNYYFATGATGALYVGDPVIANGAANTSEFQGWAPGTLPGCQIALDGAGDPITGCVVAVLPATNASTPYRANSEDRIIAVADDPNLVFQVQQNTGTVATTDVSQFAVLGTGGGGSTVTGKSSWVLDAGTAPASTVTYQLYIERLAPIPGNAVGNYAIWEVSINNHQRANVADAGRFTPV